MKCWVVIEGGCDWEEVVGVWTSEETANRVHARMAENIKNRKHSSGPYGVSLVETDLDQLVDGDGRVVG